MPPPWHFWEQLPLTPCPCHHCLELSLLGPVSLPPSLLPASAHSSHPTRCVLGSSLQTPPGSRAPAREISVCAGAKEQLRQVLK